MGLKIITIVPARLKSERLPNKPLLEIDGKPMIVHTVERILASGLQPVVVASDSQKILDACAHLEGFIPIMTSDKHTCGTERVLEAYEKVSQTEGVFDLILNVQGDEPFIDSKMLLSLQKELDNRQGSAEFWTTVATLPEEDKEDINVAKVVLDMKQNALIFTRDPISNAYKHTSLYIYTPNFLKIFCSLPPSPLEQAYRLEQMRALDNGLTLNCIPLPFDAISINTMEDLEKAGVRNYKINNDN